jgi:hypothetical protein
MPSPRRACRPTLLRRRLRREGAPRSPSRSPQCSSRRSPRPETPLSAHSLLGHLRCIRTAQHEPWRSKHDESSAALKKERESICRERLHRVVGMKHSSAHSCLGAAVKRTCREKGKTCVVTPKCSKFTSRSPPRERRQLRAGHAGSHGTGACAGYARVRTSPHTAHRQYTGGE